MPTYSREDKIKNVLFLVVSILLILAFYYIHIILLIIVTLIIGYISFFRLNTQRFNKVVRALPFFVGIIFIFLPYLNNDISIEPNFRPKITEDRDIIEIDVKGNEGFKDITIAYIYGVTLEETKGSKHFDSLPGDFEIYPRTSLDCNLVTNSFISQVYLTENMETCYIRHFTPENGCILVQVNFSIFAINFFGLPYEKEALFFYPEWGKYWLSWAPNSTVCRTIVPNSTEELLCNNEGKCINESEVDYSTIISSYELVSRDFIYPPAFCDHGLLDKKFCSKKGYKENLLPTYTLETPFGNFTNDLVWIG